VELGQRLRLLGVRVGKLVKADPPAAGTRPAGAAQAQTAHRVGEPGPDEGTLDLF
jgi:hypothetical protein